MKKITLLTIAVLAISFASCKKDQSCTCTSTDSFGNKFVVVTKGKSTKKQGESWCTGRQSGTSTYNGAAQTEPAQTCVLS